MDRLERGDTAGALEVALNLRTAGASVDDLIVGLLAPAQEEVGLRWERNHWTVAAEHLATSQSEDILAALSASDPAPPPTEGTLVLTCVEGEWHSLPARMAAERLRRRGWLVLFLGASTPPDPIASYLVQEHPRALLVSCTTPLSLAGVRAVAAAAHRVGVPVLAGGRGFGPDEVRARALGADAWAPTVAAAHRLLRTWDEPPPLHSPAPSPGSGEARALAEQRSALVEGALDHLGARFPPVATYDRRERANTVNDLGFILDLVRVALLTDDDRVLEEFVGWTMGVLASRGVPVPVALTLGLDACVDSLDPATFPRARDLLARSKTWATVLDGPT